MKESQLRIRSLKTVVSTNNEIKRALKRGEPEGLVVCAQTQTGGYGRQGRSWSSPLGGLYCSWLLRPQVSADVLSTLSLVISLALRRALVRMAPDAARSIYIKWPNDVEYVFPHERKTPKGKLCGISVEAYAAGVCVGVGVNVFAPPYRADVGGKNTAVYIADIAPGFFHAVSCNETGNAQDVRENMQDTKKNVQDERAGAIKKIFQAFTSEFIPVYNEWIRSGFEPFVQEYNDYASLTGCYVQIADLFGREIAQGKVVRVQADGRLLLRSPAGTDISVASGEAHIV